MVLNSSGRISTYINLTSYLNLGGTPKCNIQLTLAPNRIIKSEFYKAVDLAEDTLLLWLSGTTPFPIGVGRNGNPVISMNSLIAFSDLDMAEPLPIITNGFLAVYNRIIANLICPSKAIDLGINDTILYII